MKVNIYEKFLKISFVLMAMVLFASVAVFDGGDASALTYSSDTDIEFTFNSVISINLSSPNLVISDLAPGDALDSNIITVGANTNGSAGFQLSATVGVKNGTSALVNTNDSTYAFTNLSTNKATLANFSDNTWGYSYCANTAANCNGGSGTWVSGSVGSTTAGYNGLPLDNNTNADERGNGGVTLISTTGTEGEQKTVQFKIGAKASSGQASGDYTNTINFYAVANPEPQLGPVACTAGKICYNANSLTAYEGTMGQQIATADGTEIMLLASNFSRSGYGFAGWSDTYDYSGHKYGPQETITVPTGTTTNGLSLYAIWVRSEGSIQNWSGCSGLQQGSVTALTDQRDNNTYAIAKLADGNCWMIENLRLESTNSDNSTGALAQGFGTSSTYGNFSGLADAETADFTATSGATDATTANSLYYAGTQSGTATIDISQTSYAGYRMPRYNNTNTSARASTPTTNSSAMYSYGNYYTWAAAIADTTYYNTNNSSVTNTSLCPAGWHLPTGGMAYASGNTSGVNVTGDTSTFREFYNLGYDIMGSITTAYEDTPNSGYANYSSNTTNSNGDTATKAFRKFPNNFLYSGVFYTSSASIRGSSGGYWSSTAVDYDYSYLLRLFSSGVYPGTSNSEKSSGYSIRCVSGS
ncbi:MAG: hypothetical protein Q4A70_03105 [Candidatus Saccharibacteria bacterium]|nr:hypothetical protein [Candidatus Saccharibacteria bacterium]